MKRIAKFGKAVVGAIHRNSGEMLHERIPLRDMSDCLLAVYDQISRRAFQRCLVRGAQEGTDREDWKTAEDDLFARISVDFEESSGNLYALVSLPGCASAEITVAVDECWLLIAGYVNQGAREHFEEDFSDDAVEDVGEDTGRSRSAQGVICSRESRDEGGRCEGPKTWRDQRDAERPAPVSRAPRPFCVVALRAKVDPGRSVAVLSNGLLAIRMGKAELATAVPRVA